SVSALSFGSSGIVWSATSENKSLFVQIAVSASVAAVAAAGLAWGLWELRARAASESPPTGVNQQRRPTLEATNNSTIDASNASIPGDLPFQFERADQNSLIAMQGLQVTKTEKGWEIRPGAANYQFPAPPHDYAILSPLEVRDQLRATADSLRK